MVKLPKIRVNWRPVVPVLCVMAALAMAFRFAQVRYGLGQVRYFDVDEFAYLYWSSHFVSGLVPYRDFLMLSTPGFLWFLAPIFWFSHGVAPLLVGRAVEFWVFLALVVTVSALFWEMRRSFLFATCGLFLLFLPMPSDKFLEIRPDTLSVLLATIGLLFQAKWMGIMGERMDKRRRRLKIAFMVMSGIAYGASVIVIQKTAPQVILACMATGGMFLSRLKDKTVPFASKVAPYGPFIAGLVFVPVVFLATVLVGGADLSIVRYSLFQMSKETYKVAQWFFIQPGQFFYPTDIYYGMWGSHVGYWLNLVMWCGAILMASFRLLAPAATNGKKGMWQEMLLAATFLSQVLLFVYVIPLKHTQYLIPAAVFVPFYFADLLGEMFGALGRYFVGHIVFAAVFGYLLLQVYNGFFLVNGVKLGWRNDVYVNTLQTIVSRIPPNEYIYDLEGMTLYYPQPYYAPCLPIGQGAQFMTWTLPSIAGSLEKTRTKYIFQGLSHRVNALSGEDQAYINMNFEPVGDGQLLIRKGIAHPY